MERVDYESLIIQELLSAHKDETLDVRPWYQRRSVWSVPQKAYLINTIFEKKPVPSIYIRHQIDLENEKSIKEVVDGQQRILTVLSYRNDEFPALHPEYKKKVKYSDLTRNQKQDFLQTKLSVGYLIGAEDTDVIEIFGRINSISKTLNPQEKRNAQYSGDFKQFSLKQAADRVPFWRATQIFSAADISRMQEVQFMSDLAINYIEGLTDFSAKKIDDYYRKYDEEFPQAHEISDRFEATFAKLAALPPDDFVDTIFRQYQLAFSLMVAVDKHNPSVAKIHDAIRDIDDRIQADNNNEDVIIPVALVEGFTGGNLHRIKTRQIRDEELFELLA